MTKLLYAAVLAAAVTAASPALAHHAANAEFDLSKTYNLKGTLKKAELINPHSYLAFYMAGPDGAEADWSLETVTPIALRRAGLPARDAFKVGETYNFTMSPARDGSHVGFLHSITLLDGRTIAVTAPANLEAGK